MYLLFFSIMHLRYNGIKYFFQVKLTLSTVELSCSSNDFLMRNSKHDLLRDGVDISLYGREVWPPNQSLNNLDCKFKCVILLKHNRSANSLICINLHNIISI